MGVSNFECTIAVYNDGNKIHENISSYVNGIRHNYSSSGIHALSLQVVRNDVYNPLPSFSCLYDCIGYA